MVKEINVKELFDIIDLFSALYMYALDILEQELYEIDLEAMKECLDSLIRASEEKRSRDYYENGLLLMRTLLASVQNQCILNTFDSYKDKLLFYIVVSRATKHQNQPYTAKKLYVEIYEHLSTRDFAKVKKALQDSEYQRARDQLVRIVLG